MVHGPQGKNLPSLMYNHYEIDDVHCQISSDMKDSVREKIERGGFVNLAKLISKKCSQFDKDDKLEIVNKNGKMYFFASF